MPRILCLDDDPATLGLYAELFSSSGFSVMTTTSSEADKKVYTCEKWEKTATGKRTEEGTHLVHVYKVIDTKDELEIYCATRDGWESSTKLSKSHPSYEKVLSIILKNGYCQKIEDLPGRPFFINTDSRGWISRWFNPYKHLKARLWYGKYMTNWPKNTGNGLQNPDPLGSQTSNDGHVPPEEPQEDDLISRLLRSVSDLLE